MNDFRAGWGDVIWMNLNRESCGGRKLEIAERFNRDRDRERERECVCVSVTERKRKVEEHGHVARKVL